MFERQHDFPTAFAGAVPDVDEAQRLATQWVLARQRETDGEILLYLPSVGQHIGHSHLENLASRRDVRTATWRTLLNASWRGGPVLAVWPDAKVLSKISDDHRVRALCVLTSNVEEIRSWAAGVNAEPLGGHSETVPVKLSDPLVKEAIASMHFNQNNTLRAGYDRDRVIKALLVLREHGHVMDGDEIYAWVLSQGWRAERAEELREWVRKINSGATPRIRNYFKKDIYQQWQARS